MTGLPFWILSNNMQKTLSDMSEEQQIIKGFNAGYMIAKHRPVLSEKMQKGLVGKENPFAVGFIAGAKEYGKELSKPKTRTRNYVTKHLPSNPKSPERPKDKDKDMDFRDI